MERIPDGLEILSPADCRVVLALGEMILGYSQDELGHEFLLEADAFIANLEPFLQSDMKRLLTIFDMRLVSLLLTGSISRFSQKSVEKRKKFYDKFVHSKLGLFRTGASAVRALCGWSFYSLEKSWEELDYPGKTLGREDETPTLLKGKHPWEEGMEL